jgi:hypothetical protein
VPFGERTKLEDVLADIREYAGDETLPDRDILLIQAAGQVWRFIEKPMNDATVMESLLATIRVLRESSGPGKCSAEEELMKRLHSVAWECVGWLRKSGMTPETSRTTGLWSPDQDLQPLCAVLLTLLEFAKECFEYTRPRDNFGGRRRSLAFEIFEAAGDVFDLPEAVELARQTIKKGRADALGATAFLEAYFRARKESPDADLQSALLGFAKRTHRRGLATAALNVLVETGAIGEMEACDRIDEWKTEHGGGRC